MSSMDVQQHTEGAQQPVGDPKLRYHHGHHTHMHNAGGH